MPELRTWAQDWYLLRAHQPARQRPRQNPKAIATRMRCDFLHPSFFLMKPFDPMKPAKSPLSLPFELNGQVFNLPRKPYADASATSGAEIVTNPDLLALPSGQLVHEFKKSVREAHQAQRGAAGRKFGELLNLTALEQFKRPWEALIHELKGALQQRFLNAMTLEPQPAQLTELNECARQGHIQARLELGKRLQATDDPSCLEQFALAHVSAHPDALLLLGKALLRMRKFDSAFRALLLGAWCGNDLCGEWLLLLHRAAPHLYESPPSLAALEEANAYESIQGAYLLGFTLIHGSTCQDEKRGHEAIKHAASLRHPAADNGRGEPILREGQTYHRMGTLAHFEALIDSEYQPIRAEELKESYRAAAAMIPMDRGQEEFEKAFKQVWATHNPLTPRMERRFEESLTKLMGRGRNASVDPVKRARMEELLSIREHSGSVPEKSND